MSTTKAFHTNFKTQLLVDFVYLEMQQLDVRERQLSVWTPTISGLNS